jgi:hypothetical protein
MEGKIRFKIISLSDLQIKEEISYFNHAAFEYWMDPGIYPKKGEKKIITYRCLLLT